MQPGMRWTSAAEISLSDQLDPQIFGSKPQESAGSCREGRVSQVRNDFQLSQLFIFK